MIAKKTYAGILSLALLCGAAHGAELFPVSDSFNGSGSITWVQFGEILLWNVQPTAFYGAMTGTGALPDGTPWTGGELRHIQYSYYSPIGDGHHDGEEYFMELTLSGNGGQDWVDEQMTYILLDGHTQPGPATISVSGSDIANPLSFTGTGQVPFDRANGDFQYILDQLSLYSTVPENLSPALFIATLAALLALHRAIKKPSVAS